MKFDVTHRPLMVTHRPLINVLFSPFYNVDGFLFRSIIVVLGSLALALSAQITVPFYPVPMTMQVFALLILGLSFDVRLAGSTVLLYLFEGSIGLPVFAGGSGGFLHLTGPTGGYLVGFFFCVTLISWLVSHSFMRRFASMRRFFGIIFAQILGLSVLFLLGVGWLSGFIGFEKAIAVGFLPFLLGDALKIGLATSVYFALLHGKHSSSHGSD